MRIYVRRHTPRKGIRLILDTVSRMRGRATQFDTSQLGGVTNAVVTRNCLSLLTTPTKRNEDPPQPSTIGHEDPPPGSTVDESRRGPTNIYETHQSPQSTKAHRQDRSMAMTARNHDRRTATGAHWHLLRQTATGAHNDQRMRNPQPNADASPNAKVEPQPEHEYPPLRPYS